MKKIHKKSALPLDWQGAGILLLINVLMISYITSRKTTIVPSQSLDSVQQQHACKDVRKFFILPKNRYINHKIITIIRKNQIIRNKKITQKDILLRILLRALCATLPSFCLHIKRHPNNSTKPNLPHQSFKHESGMTFTPSGRV